MIERIAQALDPWAWEEQHENESKAKTRRTYSLVNARRALEVMLEPTESMLTTNIPSIWDETYGDGLLGARNMIWRAMITAALEET